MKEIETLQDWINNSNNIVFFGGAGVSTESGIPDFRSTDGLYASEYENKSPEYLLSKTAFDKETELFYKFYREKILMQGLNLDIKPNIAHIKLAELEKAGKLKAVVTQNIDTLHQEAGSKTVYQIHGTIATNHCTSCNKEYSLEDVKATEGVPHCDCGGIIKPDVVLYEENLPEDIWDNATLAVGKSDMLIVAGTSLSVYPAANLLQYYRGQKLVIINKTPTNADYLADLVIHAPLGEVFSQINI